MALSAPTLERSPRRLNVVSFADYLDDRLTADPPKQKGLRTRARLLLAAARVLEERGYHAMRVGDVTAQAQVAEGSFYIYFKDKTEISVEVLTQFFSHYVGEIMDENDGRGAFGRIRASNRRWLAVCRANPGLMRCALQVGDYAPEFGLVSQKTNHVWTAAIVGSVQRRRGEAVDTGAAMLASYMLASMTDELARKLVVSPDEQFIAMLETIGASDDDLADAISLVWHKLLYGDPPADVELGDAALRLSRFLVGGPA